MIEANLKIKYRSLDDVRAFEGNARTHSDKQIEQLVAVIKKVGFGNPIQIDEAGIILAGHGRVLAARKIGMEKIPTIELRGMTEQEKLEYNVADNKMALNAGWDTELLKLQLDKLTAWNGDLALLGFNSRELQDIVGSGAQQQAQPATYSDAQIVDAAFEHFRARGYPYPHMALHEMMQEINSIRAAATDDLKNSALGNQIADTFQPHRFDGSVLGKKSPIQGFADDKILRRILEFVVKHTNVGADFFSGLNMMSGVQVCSNFRPGFAAYLYRRFCPMDGKVLDTSTGYGGRLIGAIGSGVVSAYVGIDPSRKTHEGNSKMIAALGKPIKATLLCIPAEDIALDGIGHDFDFAFTSMPYFSKEHYSDEPTQSWKRYPTGDAWRDGFLTPTLRLQFAALKKGSMNLVNIEDVTIGKQTYPLVDWTREAGLSAGFQFERMEAFPLPASNWVMEEGTARVEHVLVFRKP